MSVSPQDVIAACEAEWEAHKGDCSGFAKAVATRLLVPLTGDANAIVDEIEEPPWTGLADGVAAAAQATQGGLVIGGLKGGDEATPSAHGHVVVVVRGDLAHGKYPTAYWGKLGGVGEKAKTVNWAWNAADRDNVTYAAMT